MSLFVNYVLKQIIRIIIEKLYLLQEVKREESYEEEFK